MKINKISAFAFNFNNNYNKHNKPIVQEEVRENSLKTDCYGIYIPIGHFEQSCHDSLTWIFGSYQKGQEVYDDVVETYNKPTRCYHDKSHLEAMIVSLDKYLITPKNAIYVKSPNDFRYAILMHDYFNGEKDDVQKSANYAVSLLKQKGENYDADYVSSLILATDYSDKSKKLNPEQQLMQDLDILVLGQSADKYDKYAQKIRGQYIEYPDTIYIPERIRILKGFMQKEHIYNIPYFQELYEEPARMNIKREINSLS